MGKKNSISKSRSDDTRKKSFTIQCVHNGIDWFRSPIVEKWSLEIWQCPGAPMVWMIFGTLSYSVLVSIFQLTCITNNGSSTTNIQPECIIEIYSSVGWWWIKRRKKWNTPSAYTLPHASALTIQNERFVEHRSDIQASDLVHIARISIVCDSHGAFVCMCEREFVYATQYKLCWVLASG